MSQPVLSDNSKISPDLQPLLSNPAGSVNVIVQYNMSPQTCANSGLLGSLICTIVSIEGGVVKTVFSLLNAVTATVRIGSIVNLSNQSNVTYISLDRTVNGLVDYSTAAVGASAAWSSGLDGSGVGIAIIDSGIYNHPDLAQSNGWQSRVVYRKNFVSGAFQTDDYGHGTHVAGIAAGNGASARQAGGFRNLQGVAFERITSWT